MPPRNKIYAVKDYRLHLISLAFRKTPFAGHDNPPPPPPSHLPRASILSTPRHHGGAAVAAIHDHVPRMAIVISRTTAEEITAEIIPGRRKLVILKWIHRSTAINWWYTEVFYMRLMVVFCHSPSQSLCIHLLLLLNWSVSDVRWQTGIGDEPVCRLSTRCSPTVHSVDVGLHNIFAGPMVRLWPTG